VASIVVTGGNSGIGLQAARELLAQGHRVVLLQGRFDSSAYADRPEPGGGVQGEAGDFLGADPGLERPDVCGLGGDDQCPEQRWADPVADLLLIVA
jgi:NAD(P)-dependent dehydrogenase (short-subunit alcohol dehydrogenase family)